MARKPASAYFEFVGTVHAGTQPHHLKAKFKTVSDMPLPHEFPLPWDRTVSEGAFGPHTLCKYMDFCEERGRRHDVDEFKKGWVALNNEIHEKMGPILSHDYFRFIRIENFPNRAPEAVFEVIRHTAGPAFFQWDEVPEPWESTEGMIWSMTEDELWSWILPDLFTDNSSLEFALRRLKHEKSKWENQSNVSRTTEP
jgi:hypothetical protein